MWLWEKILLCEFVCVDEAQGGLGGGRYGLIIPFLVALVVIIP